MTDQWSDLVAEAAALASSSDCDCGCHVNPRDYVPVCRIHGLALIKAEAGHGLCPWVESSPSRVVGRGTHDERHIGGTEFVARRCHAWAPSTWAWRHRSSFHGDDLPPYSGEAPPEYDRTTGPVWRQEPHQCSQCRKRTGHMVGESRRVCITCGTCCWMLKPFYDNRLEP